MSLFRVDPRERFSGPHQKNEQVITGGLPVNEAGLAMVLTHGRGASAESMMRFADDFTRDDIHYRATQARRHTWYPRSFLTPLEKNEPGISSGLQVIHDQITSLNNAGIPTDKIVLAGFSQGACLTTEFAARHPQRYGAIVGFSGGLMGSMIDEGAYNGDLRQTPVFLGCSNRDPHIPKGRVDQTARILNHLNANVIKKIYKGMGHTVNKEEIEQVNDILENIT